MKKVLEASMVLLGVVGGAAPVRGEEGEENTLCLFFSEKTPGAPHAALVAEAFVAKHEGKVVLRPALLVEDWSTFTKVGEASPLYRTIRNLGEETPLQVFDEEALRLATAWRIKRLPAFVLVSRGRAHVLQGSAAGLEELLGCSR